MIMRADLDALRQDDEPLRRALSMARAVAQFLDDLQHDEPADDEARVAPLVTCAACKADDLVAALRRIARRQP